MKLLLDRSDFLFNKKIKLSFLFFVMCKPVYIQPTVMHLAAVNLKMSLNETLAASTINAAHSIGRSKTHGSIEIGKMADLVILNAPR